MSNKLAVALVCFAAFAVSASLAQTCTQVGFFRNPSDCAKFYRCVDLWQNGRELTIYHFDCPVGTVFDENVSVCNWPQLAAPCENGPGAGGAGGDNGVAGVEQEQGGGGDSAAAGGVESTTVAAVESTAAPPVDNGETVVLKPVFTFQCSAEGLFPHASDCAKFWLCANEGLPEIDPQLYLCPDDYWFDEAKLRCLKKETVDCTKQPDLAKIRYDPPAKRLLVSELDSFFARYSNRYVIEV